MSGAPKDPAAEARVFRCEFREGEPSSYRSLIRQGRTVAVLSEVTGGELTRAARYREIFSDVGITNELRAEGTAWGSATLLRMDGRFRRADAELVSMLAPDAADGMRLVLLRTAARRPDAVDEPLGSSRFAPTVGSWP